MRVAVNHNDTRFQILPDQFEWNPNAQLTRSATAISNSPIARPQRVGRCRRRRAKTCTAHRLSRPIIDGSNPPVQIISVGKSVWPLSSPASCRPSSELGHLLWKYSLQMAVRGLIQLEKPLRKYSTTYYYNIFYNKKTDASWSFNPPESLPYLNNDLELPFRSGNLVRK